MIGMYQKIFAHALVFGAFVLALGASEIAWAQQSSSQLDNPLRFPTVAAFIEGLLRAIVMIALPVISFFIVLSGFYFVAARGNSGKLADAKRNFLYVIIGSALILGAWVLATLIGNTITGLVRGS